MSNQSTRRPIKSPADKRYKHGGCHRGRTTPEYRTWTAMLTRCYNEKRADYPLYGGRGIKVCDRWKNSFTNFLADMGPRPSPKHTIDRKNNDGDYEPSNCRWATPGQQNKNTRRNVNLTFDGRTQTITEWARETGMSLSTLYMRVVTLKWTTDKALTKPVRKMTRTSEPADLATVGAPIPADPEWGI